MTRAPASPRPHALGVAIVAAGTLALVLARSVPAQPGALDPTFGGGDGMVVKDIAASADHAFGLALASDGGIAVVGNARIGPRSVPAVVRFTAAGVPDPAFGTDGVATIELPADYGLLVDAAFQEDGRLVAGGIGAPPPGAGQLLVARLEAGGEPDEGWDGQGFVITGVAGETTAGGDAIALLPDGRLLVLGSTWRSSVGQKAVVARFEADGSLDETFGDGGMRLLDPSTFDDAGVDLFPLPDGRMLVLATDAKQVFLMRLLADGELDETFGEAGTAAVEFGAVSAVAARTPTGEIVVMGQRALQGESQGELGVLLVRLTAQGAPDPTFGSGGRMVVHVEDQDYPQGLAVQDDGRILVCGYAWQAGEPPVRRDMVLRVTEAGELDTTFGEGGVAYVDAGDALVSLSAIAVLDDGRIVAAGNIEDEATLYDFVAVRMFNDFMFADGFETGGLGEWAVGDQ